MLQKCKSLKKLIANHNICEAHRTGGRVAQICHKYTSTQMQKTQIHKYTNTHDHNYTITQNTNMSQPHKYTPPATPPVSPKTTTD